MSRRRPRRGAAGAFSFGAALAASSSSAAVGAGIVRLWRGGERSVVFVWSARVVVGVLGGGK